MKCILRKQVHIGHSDFCYNNEIKHYVYIIKVLMFMSHVIFSHFLGSPEYFQSILHLNASSVYLHDNRLIKYL